MSMARQLPTNPLNSVSTESLTRSTSLPKTPRSYANNCQPGLSTLAGSAVVATVAAAWVRAGSDQASTARRVQPSASGPARTDIRCHRVAAFLLTLLTHSTLRTEAESGWGLPSQRFGQIPKILVDRAIQSDSLGSSVRVDDAFLKLGPRGPWCARISVLVSTVPVIGQF